MDERRIKIFWWNAAVFTSVGASKLIHTEPSTFNYGAHFCVVFMADFISFTITDFISLHTKYFISHISFHCTSYFYQKKIIVVYYLTAAVLISNFSWWLLPLQISFHLIWTSQTSFSYSMLRLWHFSFYCLLRFHATICSYSYFHHILLEKK